MIKSEQTRRLLIEQARAYPQMKMRDVLKYLYQSAFGCEHMAPSLEDAVGILQMEAGGCSTADPPLIEPLDGAYCRVHLSYLNGGLSVDTLAKLFCASAKEEPEAMAAMEEKLAVARELTLQGILPFSVCEFDAEVEGWKASGCPAVRHSEAFRACYKPAYRVIAKEYTPFLPLLAKIDQMIENGRVTLAIEGGSASGKTTLGVLLERIYGCTVFHMDDFFLRPEQRTPDRYAEVGGNVDRERFLAEVLIPLKEHRPIVYRKFDCSTQALGEPVQAIPTRLTVIEGAYSMHPDLADFYDLSVFLDISTELQKKRIEKRNTLPMAKRFFTEWIPLEAIYFSQTNARRRCDLSIVI